MGSTPGSGAGKPETPDQITQLGNIAERILHQVGPVRKEFLGQQLEALRTGGVGARIPIIQRAVEASKQATGQALKGTREEGAAQGLAGSPFLQNILAQTRLGGQQAASQIPTEIAQGLISQVPGTISSLQSQGLQGLLASGEVELQNRQFAADQFVKLMEDIKSSIMAATTRGAAGGGSPNYASGGGYGGTASNAYIAGQAYGVDNPYTGR